MMQWSIFALIVFLLDIVLWTPKIALCRIILFFVGFSKIIIGDGHFGISIFGTHSQEAGTDLALSQGGGGAVH